MISRGVYFGTGFLGYRCLVSDASYDSSYGGWVILWEWVSKALSEESVLFRLKRRNETRLVVKRMNEGLVPLQWAAM